MVDQPTVEDTISILRGLKERYEVHHGVRIKDAALVAAAVLSNRYITDRFLPDKAIDLVDEAAAKLRTEMESMPAELDEVKRRVMQLEIEREALKRETDQASRERLQKLEKELAEVKDKRDDAAGAMGDRDGRAREARARSRPRSSRPSSKSNRPSASTISTGPRSCNTASWPALEKQLATDEEQLIAKNAGGKRLIKEEVDEEDIAEVVAAGPGFRCRGCWKAKCRSSRISKRSCTSA